MATAVACKGSISLSINQASSRLPGSFPDRRSTGWGRISLIFFRRWPDLSLRWSSLQLSWSLSREKSNAEVYLQGDSGVPSRAQEQKVTLEGVVSLNDGDGGGDDDDDDDDMGALETFQQQGGDPQKIWMRKQTRTRALGLNAVAKSTAGRESFAVRGKQVELNRNGEVAAKKRWFPHGDAFQLTEGTTVSSRAVMELLDPFISEERKQRIENVVDNRTFSVCTVVEGLSDVGNVSAICRTADAMGFQSIHIISNNRTLRYKENHRTSAGAEKWLHMERWEDTQSCIKALKARGYRIAVTHIADDTVSIHDMDWTVPTAIVLGNEHRGISEEAITLSDVRCSIPMAGMVESFNVSVAAAILMHHAAMDRITRLGFHGDLSEEERCSLLASFYMRHRDDTKNILKELVVRKGLDARLEAKKLHVLDIPSDTGT